MPACVHFAVGNKYTDNIRYKYDSCGNICEITQNGHLVARYTYDTLNRLVREDNKPLDKTVLFSYDRAGNITERCKYAYTEYAVVPHAETSGDHYNYDYDGDKLVSYNGAVCEYNNLGNPTKYRNNVCEWQYGKWLTKYGNTTFGYDTLGRRTKKGSITFTYDNDGRILKQSNGLEFFYDNAGVVAVKFNNVMYFYRKDAQGNIIALLYSNGNVAASYEYDAWGNHTVKLDTDNAVLQSFHIGNLNPFRYRGYIYDTET